MNINKASITKKLLIITIMTVLFITIILVKLPSFAETSQSTNSDVLYLKLNEFMTQDTPHMGYAIGDPNTNGSEGNAHHIWNIVQTTEQESRAMELLQQRMNNNMNMLNVLRTNNIATAPTATNQNIYCVNAEIGFNDTKTTVTYDASYDMLTQRNEIKTKLQSLVEDEIPKDENNGNTKIKEYDVLLALLDMLYLNDGSGQQAEAEKKAFLEKAGIKWSDFFGCYHCEDTSITSEWHTLLTNDDIKAVQQAAIWYFTNYYKTETTTSASPTNKSHYEKYDKTSATKWLNYKLEPESRKQ